jgi:hypothetical protein
MTRFWSRTSDGRSPWSDSFCMKEIPHSIEKEECGDIRGLGTLVRVPIDSHYTRPGYLTMFISCEFDVVVKPNSYITVGKA